MTDTLVEERELSADLDQHLRECDECVQELALSEQIWELIPRVDPSTAEDRAPLFSWWQRHHRQVAAAAAAAVLFGAGLLIGMMSPAEPGETNVAVLEEKVDSLEELVALSLLEQSSASARLEAITRIAEMERPSPGAVTGLIHTAVTDPNPNVRLAAVEAARPLLDRPGVYDELAERLTIETSPLVQIALVDLLLEDPDAGTAEIERLLERLIERQDVEDEVVSFVRQRTGESI